MHMYENLIFLPVSLADSSDRNHVQVNQAVFFSVSRSHDVFFKSEYVCLVPKYFKQKLHDSQKSNLCRCFMSNPTTVTYMHVGFHGKATVMVFDLQQFVILATG